MIPSFKNFRIQESTGNYYPGYSDDGTADNLSDIRKKTSIIQNNELRKKKNEVLEPYKNEPKQYFYQKWMYANMILTSLQDGFYIDSDLINTAFQLYSELINDKYIDVYRAKEKDPDMFKRHIIEVIIQLKELMSLDNLSFDKNYYYSPNFMDKNRINEDIEEKSLGKFGVDSGSFLIVDPAYIDKMETFKKNEYKEGEYILKGTNGKGVYISSTGGDGSFDVIAKYDTNLINSHLPYEIVIKLRSDKH